MILQRWGLAFNGFIIKNLYGENPELKLLIELVSNQKLMTGIL